MSVTDGCKIATNQPMGSNVRTLILTTDQLFAIAEGLKRRIIYCGENLAIGSNPAHWSNEQAIAIVTLNQVQEAM